MNYRHAFHAGNFADLLKHAALLAMLRALTKGAPLTVVDTHGGAGMYDLAGEMALKSGEAAVGIGRLMADAEAPEALQALTQAVARFPAGHYPGSPLLAAQALRREDRLIACEIHPQDSELLRRALAKYANAKAVAEDGYAVVRRQDADLVLIDPPFERRDDYAQAAAAVEAVLGRNPAATLCVWLPLKDLETFDAFLRDLEAPGALVVELRLRPLTDPMKMNGCALVIANPTPGLDAELKPACDWIVETLGEPSGEARLWSL